MRLPPKWLRRILIAPAVVVGVALALVSMPIWIIGALFVSRMVPGKWRIFRIAWFLFLYLVVEAAALVAMFGMWIGSGFGWKLEDSSFSSMPITRFWAGCCAALSGQLSTPSS